MIGMSTSTLNLDTNLRNYLLDVSLREPEVLERLREETAKDKWARMQISPEQGQFMTMLAKLIGARNTLEVGTYTGYSAIAVALALPPGGKVIAMDVDEESSATARRYFALAEVADLVDLRVAPALETLDALLASGKAGTFDMAFIDADKENYLAYYERCLQLLRTGGLILVDNVLWSGRVADTRDNDESTRAIRNFNRVLKVDDRIDLSLIPIGDGLTLARKR